MVRSDFEQTFDDYHDLIRREIASDTPLEDKLSKVEQLVLLMDSFVRDRSSKEYREEALELERILKKGEYFDEYQQKTIMINYNQAQTRRNRLSIFRQWLSLMLVEETRFKLSGNINRVDFGD